MIKTVIGSFDKAEDAERATRDLRGLGFSDADINLVVSNVSQGDADTDLPVVGDGTGPVAKGAVAGGVLGGAAGLAASLAGLAIPGIGPILTAGPIVATLAGAGAGAVAGGVIGRLTDLGVEKKEAALYAEAARRGGTLVTLRTDEAHAVEHLGLTPRVVVGSARNVKITYAEDIELAGAILTAQDPEPAGVRAQ